MVLQPRYWILGIVFLIGLSGVYAIPHGISGTIYESEGHLACNVSFEIYNLRLDETIKARVCGNFDISLPGMNGDIIILSIKDKDISKEYNLTLDGVLRDFKFNFDTGELDYSSHSLGEPFTLIIRFDKENIDSINYSIHGPANRSGSTNNNLVAEIMTGHIGDTIDINAWTKYENKSQSIILEKHTTYVDFSFSNPRDRLLKIIYKGILILMVALCFYIIYYLYKKSKNI